MNATLQLFEQKQVRTHWDNEQEKWCFSIIDVIVVLTEQQDYQSARNYWKVLKHRPSKEGNETLIHCNQFKMVAEDGKMRMIDIATTTELNAKNFWKIKKN